MDVEVVTCSGEVAALLNLRTDATIQDLKNSIEEKEGTPKELQSLAWKDIALSQLDAATTLVEVVDSSAPVVLVRWDVIDVQNEEAKKLVERYGVRYSGQHHFFWAIHEGNHLAACGILRCHAVDVNAKMLPTDFVDARREHQWPYCSFDGRYEDRALHLATRCRDEATVKSLLACRADPGLVNDNGETPLDIALGQGKKWKSAYLRPADFGGNLATIAYLLREHASLTKIPITISPGNPGAVGEPRTGKITKIIPGSQAEACGIREGWMIHTIEGKPYEQGLLQEHVNGSQKYTLEFYDPDLSEESDSSED